MENVNLKEQGKATQYMEIFSVLSQYLKEKYGANASQIFRACNIVEKIAVAMGG